MVMSKASRCLGKFVFSRHDSANAFWGKGETTLLQGKRHGSQETFVEPLLVQYASHCWENRATSLLQARIWKVLPNMVFPPIWGGKNGGVLSMRMQVILDSSFRPPGFSPYKGWVGKESSGTGLLATTHNFKVIPSAHVATFPLFFFLFLPLL